jgi:hypothetical protein
MGVTITRYGFNHFSHIQREGVPPASITIMSSEPIRVKTNNPRKESNSRIGLFALAGAIVGATAGSMLTVLTSQSVNLVTGGMPIISPWAFGIIIYELTALGAILTALARMIYEARLARRGALADYDEAVADGRIVLSINCPDDECANKTENALGKIVTRRQGKPSG